MNHARSIGLNTRGLKLLFFTPAGGACTVAALQTVGAFWSSAGRGHSGATARLLNRPLPAPAGHRRRHRQPDQLLRRFWLSYYLDGATGIIVVAQTLFLLTFIAAPEGAGLLASRAGRPRMLDHSWPRSGSIYGQRDNGIDGRRRALRAVVGLSGA